MGDEALEIRRVHAGEGSVEACPEWAEIAHIRTVVFIEGQDCPEEEEWDGLDDEAVQFLARMGGEAVGTFRWRKTRDASGDAVAKLERFAVLETSRGHGIGRALVEAAIEDVRRSGLREMAMHAQSHLESWYRSFGFRTVGEPFDEAGIVHVKMVAVLPD